MKQFGADSSFWFKRRPDCAFDRSGSLFGTNAEDQRVDDAPGRE